MMNNNKTESEFFSQIRHSLNSYEEDYIPGAWEDFLLKQKKRKRKVLWRIASGIAACLIIGYMGSIFILSDKNDALKINRLQIANIKNTAPDSVKNTGEHLSTAVIANNLSFNQLSSKETKSISKTSLENYRLAENESKPSEFKSITINRKDSVINSPTFAADVNIQKQNKETDKIKTFSDTIQIKATDQLLSKQTTKENPNVAAVTKRKIRFGLNFSPGINTTSSASSFNYTGGLTADISLFGNFQLSTGIQLENQRIVNKSPGISTFSSAPQNQTNTKLVNLDLPVNITWRFLSEKSNTYYVSTGISSLVYLKQEDKNTSYSQVFAPATLLSGSAELKTYSIVEAVSVEQNSFASERAFDFAGRLNFMLGVERKLSSRIYLHLEPYAKIPVAGMSAENLKHTSTGINFKISF
jgi:hypothetical protein